MGTVLVRLPQLAGQNLTLDKHGKPQIKAGSPAAKAARTTETAYKKVVGKAMTDAQLKHRKRLSAGTTIVTSTLGLGALGAKGGGNIARRIGAARKIPKLMRVGRKIENAAVPVTLASGGLGGLSGYNYASIQRAEAKRRVQPVKKAYDPEKTRQRRNQAAQYTLAGVGAGSLGVAGADVYRNRGKLQQVRHFSAREKEAGEKATKVKHAYRDAQKVVGANEKKYLALNDTMSKLPTGTATAQMKADRLKMESALRSQHNELKGRQAAWNKMVGRRVKAGKLTQRSIKGLKPLATRTGILVGVGAAGLGGAAAVHSRRKSSSWGQYAPRYRPQH